MALDQQRLTIAVDASTEVLRRELVRAGDSIEKFRRESDTRLSGLQASFQKIGDFAKGFGVGLLGALSGGALVNGIRDITSRMDDLATAAARAGGVGIEKWQELTYAFERLDVSSAQVASGLEKLAVNVGAALANPAGESAGVLRTLGVSLDALARQDTDARIETIIDALGRVEDPALRAKLAVSLFGREAGAGFAQALADGGVALDGWTQKLRDAGMVLREDQVQALAAANDAVERLAARYEVFRTSLLGDAVLAFEGNARALETWAGRYQKVADLFGYLKAIPGLAGIPVGFQAGADALNAAASKASPEIVAAGRFGPKKAPVDLAATAATSASARPRSAVSRPAQAGPTLQDQVNAFLAAKPGQAIDESWVKPLEDLRDVSDLARDRWERLLASMSQRIPTPQADAIAAGVEAAAEASKRFADTVVNAFDAIAFQGASAGDVIKRLALQLLVVEPLLKSIRAASERLFEGIWAGGGGGHGGLLGGVLGGLFGGFFAEGGTLAAGRWGIVGERGPELIGPYAQPVTVSPMSRAAGASVTYNIDARGSTDPAETQRIVVAALAAATPSIIDRATAKTMDQFSRRRI